MAMRTANEPKRDLERVAGVADAAADLVASVDQVERDHRADVAAGARDLRVRTGSRSGRGDADESDGCGCTPIDH